MSVWDKFNKLTTLNFDYEGVAPGIIPAIYANSKNQVDIAISVEVEGLDGKPLNLKKEDFKNLLYFCDYITGEKINSPWNISNDSNDYTKPVLSSNPHRDKKLISGPTYIHRYLSCSESNIQKIFSVGIAVPGIGDFDTSKNGTNTPNCPKGGSGSPFRSPKSLTISTLHPIDYSQDYNVDVRHMPSSINDFEKIVTDMDVYCAWAADPKDCTDYVGVSSKAKFTIGPKQKGISFKSIAPRRNNANLSTCHFPVLPDMVRGVGGENFDVQFVFVNQSKYGVLKDGKINIRTYYIGANHDYVYMFGTNDDRHHFTQDLTSDYITVNICNHRIPRSGAIALNWWDMGLKIEVDVTDDYGNSGVITIKAPDNRELWPKLLVNGV